MNAKNFELASQILGKASYIQNAVDGRHQKENLIRTLLSQRKIPADGWDDASIELFLQELSAMDSNNFVENAGVGEREGRLFSGIVARRHFGLAHGIGRSGDISEIQPKAAGSSLLYKLTNRLALDSLRLSGLTRAKACLVVPMATGMALTLTMLTLKASRPEAKYVIWPRIDQKTCLKCIITAGLTPIVVENLLEGDELRTNVEEIKRQIEKVGSKSVLCILSTTSCFAPRAFDKVDEIAVVAKQSEVPHLVNNAYGLQASKCTHLLNEAMRVGRVDAFVQSTDKNYMVPVGGVVIAAPEAGQIDAIAKIYPGRASGSPITDLFITFLSMGSNHYLELLKERKELFEVLKLKLDAIAKKHGERVLVCPNNTISMAMSLASFRQPKQLGAVLFNKCVSGLRVVDPSDTKEVGGIQFKSYGSHADDYPCAYLTVASAIGITQHDIEVFIPRLDHTLLEHKKKYAVASGVASAASAADLPAV